MTWTPDATHQAKAEQERADRRSGEDTATALEVLKVAERLLTPAQRPLNQAPDATGKPWLVPAGEVAAYAEVLWQWVTTDSWPPKP